MSQGHLRDALLPPRFKAVLRRVPGAVPYPAQRRGRAQGECLFLGTPSVHRPVGRWHARPVSAAQQSVRCADVPWPEPAARPLLCHGGPAVAAIPVCASTRSFCALRVAVAVRLRTALEAPLTARP